MNEWERLHQQAKRYQAEYPPGTRIMLLSMGRDLPQVLPLLRWRQLVPAKESMAGGNRNTFPRHDYLL